MKKAKILLADDDRVILTTLSEGLQKSGYKVIKANNGEEALELCIQEKPDLAILDIRMPGMSGIEVSKELMENTDIPFIFLTAYADDKTVSEAVSEGTFAYMVKPIDITQLIPAVEASLNRAAIYNDLKITNTQLNTALKQDRSLNVAIGLIMERYHLTEKSAFETLRKYARSNQCKMTELTSDILHSAELLNKIHTP